MSDTDNAQEAPVTDRGRIESEANPRTRPDTKTLDFILTRASAGVERQFTAIDALDGKINSIFGIASGVIALAGLSAAVGKTMTVGPMGASTTSSAGSAVVVTFAIGTAVASYVLAAVAAIIGWRVRDFETSDYADSLWEEHWDEDLDEVKLMVASGIAGVYTSNNALLHKKAEWIAGLMVATAVEVVSVGFAVAYQAFQS